MDDIRDSVNTLTEAKQLMTDIVLPEVVTIAHTYVVEVFHSVKQKQSDEVAMSSRQQAACRTAEVLEEQPIEFNFLPVLLTFFDFFELACLTYRFMRFSSKRIYFQHIC